MFSQKLITRNHKPKSNQLESLKKKLKGMNGKESFKCMVMFGRRREGLWKCICNINI